MIWMDERTVTIPIQDLGLSTQSIRALLRMNIPTLNELVKRDSRDLSAALGNSTESAREILELQAHADEIFDRFEARQRQIDEIFDSIKDYSIDDVSLSAKAKTALTRGHILTVGEMLRMSQKDIMKLRSVGDTTRAVITAAIEAIIAEGPAYFSRSHTTEQEDAAAEPSSGKGFDYAVIDLLSEQFNFKPIRMAEWFDLSRQGIYNIMEKRTGKHHETWTGKQLTQQESDILNRLVRERTFEYKDAQVQCCCMNNRQDDLACLFLYENEIKCFFLKDLPAELQQEIIAANYHRFTERELSGEAAGKIVSVLKKPFFLPAQPDRFRTNARTRGMSLGEYALFLSGYPLIDQRSVTDDQITAFFDENLVDGKVYLSSDPKNQWIRSLASRNGYSIKDFIALYGYESKMDGTELTTDGARERHIADLKQCIVHDNVVYFPTDSRAYRVLSTYCYSKGYVLNDYVKSLGFVRTTERPELTQDTLEQDMQVRQSDGKFEDKVFAAYPLIGSKILKPETLEQLNTLARKYIDTVLGNPRATLTLRAEMQITLALINHAKSWKSEENSNFWSYISLQFGYRDASGAVVRLLQNALEHAMKHNRRLFIEDATGRAFKSTVVIHALTTRKSWMLLFDFLFDFYKNNLNWNVIPGDPLLAVMTRSLQQKLAGDSAEDMELTISSRVYSFQEGIRKLVLYRPVFTRGLFEKLIAKIDALVNSEDTPAKTYEEQLCEEWFKEKITAIAGTKRTARRSQSGVRDVAIDYSRIHAKYVLKHETELQLVLPDIRLKQENVDRAVLAVYYNGAVALQQNMSWYGNELGKTLNGVALSLPALPSDAETLNIQVRITCDQEEIYHSEDTLNRRVWVFYGANECSVSQIRKDNYTVILPKSAALEAENAEIAEIDGFQNPGLRAFFLELKDGYTVTAGGRLIAFDSESGTGIRVIAPAESAGLPRVSADDQEYCFAYSGSVCRIHLGSADLLQQFILLRNGKQVGLSSLMPSDDGLAYTVPLSGETDACRLQLINLADERLVFDRSFLLIQTARCGFNREFYYSAADYRDAEYRIAIDGFSETVPFGAEDEEVRIPYRNGTLHALIPRVEIQETTGTWMDGSVPAWYIGDIPQTSLLKVSAPAKLEVRFYVGGKDIMYDGQGLVALGNVLQSFCGTEEFSLTDVVMKLCGVRQSSTYLLARVCYTERFLGQPEFWTKEQRLYWNQGGGFIGKKDRTFTLSLLGETDAPIEFQVDESTEYVALPPDMPIGNYRYEISILTGSLFKKEKKVIAEGDCVVGDPNRLRFRNRRIVIDAITDDLNEGAGRIRIRPCYIDTIEFQGIEDTSEGNCPVYHGVMYTTGYHGERYEFSFDCHTNQRGVTKMMVNPVRIVYLNDFALCITDSDGDGLYYYHYYDRYTENKVYALTDHAYTKQNMRTYANADLYSYRTERI